MVFDLAIIGGGVNGAGLARDAAGRGLSVLLLEKRDFASGASSASTKLIHGGLRYLEHGAFRLVREALEERERLSRLAPHLVRPMRFILPLDKGARPAWMLRLGLAVYDALGNRSFEKSHAIDLEHAGPGLALKPEFRRGFAYADCWVDDARLVVLNAIDARERGAEIHTRSALKTARRIGAVWAIEHEQGQAQARILINAAGAEVNEVARLCGVSGQDRARLVKGSHIITRRLFDGEDAFILQNRDGRVIFAIPYEGDFTLIGTTDIEAAPSAAPPAASPEEIDYLCAAASHYLRTPIAAGDVLHAYAGLRSLYDDGAAKAQEVTRDYVLALDDEGAPMLTIYGGKLTTYRRLAEAALAKLAPHLANARPAWTHAVPLPGGDLPAGGAPAYAADLRRRFPFLSEREALRIARAYGARAEKWLHAEARTIVAAGLSVAELDYLLQEEAALTVEDVMWRRTKAGLHATREDELYLAEAIVARRAIHAAAS